VPLVAFTDYGFENIDIERPILEPLGCTFTGFDACRDQAGVNARVKEADVVLTSLAPVSAEAIEAMTRCRLIVRCGIGFDNVDLDAAAARGIPVCNIPEYCTDEVADQTLALVLALTRRISQSAAKVRAGVWRLGVPMGEMRALKDLSVGVVGYGRIGREVALRLKPFGCRIMAADPRVPAPRIRDDGYDPVGLSELLAASDLVTLHCPSTPLTRRMINAASLATMKRGSLLVNASRGTLVDTDALVEALRSGALAGAALDVTDPEPIPGEHPLLSMENVLVTPHTGAASAAAGLRLRTAAAETVAAFLRGDRLPNVVNGVGA
jgi:D-3-phosphoglycerate dehydrogenase